MKKLIVLILALAAAWWYFDGGRKMTEASIREHYAEQLMAFDQHDAEALCDGMTDDFESRSVIIGSEGTQRTTLDRDSACREMTRGLEAFRKLSTASAGMLTPRLDVDIKKIELSIDRKTAVVESVSTLKVGDMMVQRGRSTDTLVRRMGRIKVQRGETKTWVYGD